uniref:Peptidase_M13_N domain-containing protein n=1 Tax=Steinernema glaseri TaxID=37863 RepID=A0A1I8AB61_9BILA
MASMIRLTLIGLATMLGALVLFFAFQGSFARPEGFQLASEILGSAVNLSVDPCDDFYSYACGNWVKTAKLSYGRTRKDAQDDTTHDVVKNMIVLLNDSTDSGSKAINGLKIAYKKCMSDENRLALFLERVAELGGWPILDKHWDSRNFDLARLLRALRNDFLFQVQVKRDFLGNPELNLLEVSN